MAQSLKDSMEGATHEPSPWRQYTQENIPDSDDRLVLLTGIICASAKKKKKKKMKKIKGNISPKNCTQTERKPRN